MLTKLSLTRTLVVGFGILVILVAAIGTISINSSRSISNDLTELYDDRFDHIIELAEMIREMAQLRSTLYQAAISQEEQERVRLLENARHNIDRIETLILLCEDHCIRTENLAAFDPVQSGWGDFKQSANRLLDLDYSEHEVNERDRLIDNLEATYGTLDSAAWSMALGQDRLGRELYNRAIASAQTAQVTSVVIITTSLLLGIALATTITRSIRDLIHSCLQVVGAIASGDLTKKLSPDLLQRRDAMGLLCQGIDRMQNDLSQLVSTMQDVSTDINNHTSELSRMAETNHRDLEKHKGETDQVATAMEEMTHSIKEVAQITSDASSHGSSANAFASEGIKSAKAVFESVHQLSGNIEKTAQAIHLLSNESSKIEKVLLTINDIADQTNLLALNAAIESARAGEAGRGFAVVADEVRALAKRTQDSTREIEQTISELISNANESIQASESGIKEAKNVVAQTSASVAAMETIESAINELSNLNAQIANSAEEQRIVTAEMSHSITNIRDSAEGTEAVSLNVKAVGEELSRLSRSLSETSRKFTL